jgi:hypothetical protein
MLGKGSFKDGANRSDRYNQLETLKYSMATRGESGRASPIRGRHSPFGESSNMKEALRKVAEDMARYH